MSGTTPEKAYGLALRLLFGGALLLLAYAVVFMPVHQLLLFVPDDASYYLKIAQNVNQGYGFSFDGLHTTNGFHPLWQWVCVGLLWPAPMEPETALRAVLLFQVLLLAVAARLLYGVLRKYASAPALWLGTACFVAFVLPLACNGMETALLVCLLALLLFFGEKYRPFTHPSPKTETRLGLLLGLTVLTRLDFVFLCVPIYLIILRQGITNGSVRQTIRRFLPFSAGLALPVLPYLVYNQATFGHMLPISGYLKFQTVPVGPSAKLADLLTHRESFFAVLPPVFAVWFWLRRNTHPHTWLACLLAVLAAGLSLLFLYHLLFMRWIYFSWYFVPYSLFAALALTFWAHHYSIRYTGRLWVLCGVLGLALLGYRVQNFWRYSVLPPNWSQHSYRAALWAKAHTQPHDILAMKDAGHFSFFSGRRVINLDGLVNTFDFQQTLQQKRLRQYLRQNRVRYLAQHSVWSHEDITDGLYETYYFSLTSAMYGVNSDSIPLRKENEVYRSEPYREGGWRVVFLVWEPEGL